MDGIGEVGVVVRFASLPLSRSKSSKLASMDGAVTILSSHKLSHHSFHLQHVPGSKEVGCLLFDLLMEVLLVLRRGWTFSWITLSLKPRGKLFPPPFLECD